MRHETGIGRALDELVAQFADPYAFLRELVQNAIDAGSSDVDVSVEFEGEGEGPESSGVVTIRVDDYGAGMDREIIDSKLTRLFSSDKDGDRTKIGKFGIGFVSVFALDPDAVVVDTARAGEHWRVIFDRDRTFRRVRLDTPGEGTKIRVIKAGTRADADVALAKTREVLTYWCRFLPNEVRVDGEAINRDFDVDVRVRVRGEKETGTAVIWPPRKDEAARWGFFNRGLTLREYSPPPEHSQAGYSTLAGLSFFVTSPLVEHTLTRDDVIQDKHYFGVLDWVMEVVKGQLVPVLLHEAHQLARGVEPPVQPRVESERVLAALLKVAEAGWLDVTRHGACAIFDTIDGAPVTIETLLRNKSAWRPRPVYWAEGQSRLTAHVVGQGGLVLRQPPQAWAFAKYWVPIVKALTGDTGVKDVSDVGVLHDLVSEDTLARMAPLCRAVASLLEDEGTRCRGVTAGHLDTPGSLVADEPAISLADLDAPSPREESKLLTAGFFVSSRHLVLNVDHPLVAAAAELAVTEPEFAALQILKSFFLGERLDVTLDTRLAELAWARRWSRSNV